MTDKIYFKAKKDSELHKDWFAYIENTKVVRKAFDDFATEQGIESKSFAPCKKQLIILPSEKDEITFDNQLKKHVTEEGAREFKVKSVVNKAWVEFIKDVEILRKPSYWDYMVGIGSYTGTLFSIKDTVYGSIETTYTYEKPVWMEEIKASEYFKDVEDYNESIKSKK